MNTEYNLFVSDYHVPFHLKSGHKIFLDVCKYIKPTKVILGGDIIDFFGISRFLRSHRSTVTLKDELNATKKVLSEIRNANKNAEIIYMEGNHSYRLFKFIALHARELGSLEELTIQNLLGLDKYGIKFHKNNEPPEGYSDFVDTYLELCSGDGKQVSPLIVGHFNKCCGNGGTAKRLIEEKGDVSIIQGHTHRVEMYAKKTITGKILLGVESGGLFDSEQNSYIRSPNWQNGFTIIEVHNASKDYNILPAVIKNHKLVFNQKVFIG